MKLSRVCLLISLAWVLGMSTAQAHDHWNLEEGLPIELEDAYPTNYLNREFQQQSRFQLEDDGRTKFTLDQRIEYGIIPNGQIAVSVPVQLGTAVKEDMGNVQIKGLYNLNMEHEWLPAFAVAGALTTPTGPGSAGVDTELKGIVSKTMPKTWQFIQVHGNMSWLHNNHRKSYLSEREDRYKLAVGGTIRITPTTQFLADYVREQTIIKDRTHDIVEVGIRQMITPLTLIGVGVGMGVSNNSPDFRATLSLQKMF